MCGKVSKKLVARVYFRVETGYIHQGYRRLKELGGVYIYDARKKVYVWFFPYSVKKDVEAVLGHVIELEKDDLVRVVKDYPTVVEEMGLRTEVKGESEVYIVKEPDAYIVKTIVRGQERRYTIPYSVVEKLWLILFNYPMNRKIRTYTVAKHFCREMGWTRFFKENGVFNWKEFFGSRRVSQKQKTSTGAERLEIIQGYFTFYYAIKVLQAYEVVRHYQGGWIERTGKYWNPDMHYIERFKLKSGEIMEIEEKEF